MPSYCLINDENHVMNLLYYNETPNTMVQDNGFLVENTVNACIGWTYIDGVFYEPPRNPNPPELPTLPSDPKDKIIEDMKADIQTLSASLAQVLQTLNGITNVKPTI